MLADYHGSPLAGPQVLGQQQDPPGKHFRPNVQHHFVTHPLLGVVDPASPGTERDQRFVEFTQHFFPEVFAVPFAALNKLVRRVRLVAELLRPGFVCQLGSYFVQEKAFAHMFRSTNQPLHVVFQRFHLTLLPFGWIKRPASVHRNLCLANITSA